MSTRGAHKTVRRRMGRLLPVDHDLLVDDGVDADAQDLAGGGRRLSHVVTSTEDQNILRLLQRESKQIFLSSSDAEGSVSDSSIEIIGAAQIPAKRTRDLVDNSDDDDESKADYKKKAKVLPPVSTFSLSVALHPPSPSGAVSDEPPAGISKKRQALLSHLAATNTATSSQEVVLLVKKPEYLFVDRPDSIAITTPESAREQHSLTPLLYLDPIDARNEIVRSRLKEARSSTRGKLSLALGERSLLDALIFLESRQRVSLEAHLDFDSTLAFTLRLEVGLDPSFFSPPSSQQMIMPQRILLTHLFPSPSSQPVSIDVFYASLPRAPLTRNGLSIGSQGNKNALLDTDEERAARERRKAKGKGKARNQDDDEMSDSGDGNRNDVEWEDQVEDEDILLRPKGLEATLLPFQSRSVRWMLAREGKRAIVATEPNAAHNVNDDVSMADQDLDGDIDLGPARGDKEDRHSSITLEPLPRQQLLAMARGPLWEAVELEGKTFWLNRVACALSEDDPGEALLDGERGEEGKGLLSEEMGLGKTLMVLSLILLHHQPDRNTLPTYHSVDLDSDVQPCDLTLIIAPSAIVAQWAAELKKHAPSLRILRYEGIKSVKATMGPSQVAAAYDVLLTTFDVLRREVVLARKPHERALRSGPEGRHRYRRSMLVQINFLRVIMDEAQMLGNEMSLASETASLIPRKYSFCVTGTPIKEKLEDLQGLLRFLRVEPVASSRASMLRLLNETPSFIRLWAELGARTMKSHVSHELELPPQSRMLVPVEFSKTEQYYYDQRYLEALESLRLESDGAPKESDPAKFSLERGELTRWLEQLRQLCCHPQVGIQNKRFLGTVLKTVDEVLASMADGAVGAVHSEQRQRAAWAVKGAQLRMWDKEDCERFEGSVKVFQRTVREMEDVAGEVLIAITEVWKERKAERTRRGRSASESSFEGDGQNALGAALSLGLEEEESSKALEIPLSEKERALAARLAALRSRLREVLLVTHSAHFFAGSAYFNMGKFEELESKAYAKADEIRQTLLTPFETRVETATKRLGKQLEDRETKQALTFKDLEFPFSKKGGAIVGQQLFEDIDSTTDALNGQAELIWQRRDMIFQMMTTKVSISGDDATGDEYAERAELQEKLGIYIAAYESLLMTWRYALTGESSSLSDGLNADLYEKERKAWSAATGAKRKREKKTKSKKLRINLQGIRVPTIEQGDSPADVLTYELLVEHHEVQGERPIAAAQAAARQQAEGSKARAKGKKKKKTAADDDLSSDEDEVEEDERIIPIRHLINALKRVVDNDAALKRVVDNDAALPDAELEILSNEQQRLREQLKPKEKLSDRLRSELTDITRAFNTRLTYFAQLQIISDEVIDPDFYAVTWRGLPQELQACKDEAIALDASILKKLQRRRYLESLQQTDGGEDEQICIICADQKNVYVLTECGHKYCKDCFSAWHGKSKACAICKRTLPRGSWEVVNHQASPTVAQEHTSMGATCDSASAVFDQPIKLNTMGDEELALIHDIETAQPLSSKSDLIVKQVKHIRHQDATAKVVVFSAWTEALEILMQAFTRNGLQYVRLEGGGKKEAVVGRFINDVNVVAFFLHTRSAAAGLNLTCARTVILVEPLLHPSLERQAVGRVDRIGQTKATQVLQFSVTNTADERVAQLRGRQKTSLFMGSGTVDRAREARVAQGDVVKSPSKKAASDDVLDDEDSLTRCLLSPEHFVNLQQGLLPPQLR